MLSRSSLLVSTRLSLEIAVVHLRKRSPLLSATFVRSVRLCYGFTIRLGEYVVSDIKLALVILDFRPEYIHPFASAIDTPLEAPEKMVSTSDYVILIYVLVAGGVVY